MIRNLLLAIDTVETAIEIEAYKELLQLLEMIALCRTFGLGTSIHKIEELCSLINKVKVEIIKMELTEKVHTKEDLERILKQED